MVRRLFPRVGLLLASLAVVSVGGRVGSPLAGGSRVVSVDPARFPLVPQRGIMRAPENPALIWELDPASSLINSDGFRDRTFEHTRAPGTHRIVVLGDSVAFGYGVDLEDSFPKVLERLLNDVGTGHEVLNFGVGGYNTTQEVELYRERAQLWQPDVVLLSYVMNDAMPMGNVLAGVREKGGEKRSGFSPQIFDFERFRLCPRALTEPSDPFVAVVRQYARPEHWPELRTAFSTLAATAQASGSRSRSCRRSSDSAAIRSIGFTSVLPRKLAVTASRSST